MVEIQVAYIGELRNQAIHVPSGATVLTDAPVDNHGKGQSFSPTDLLATAVGCCMTTVMGIVAKRYGWDLKGLSVRVFKHMTTQGPRRVRLLEIEMHLPLSREIDPSGILEKAALTCPVYLSLDPAIEKKFTIHWAGKSTGG